MSLLKVTKAKTSPGLLKVGKNTGMQGSKVKVQGGNVPGYAIQGGNPYARPIQGGNVNGSWLQGGAASLLASAKRIAVQAAARRKLEAQRRREAQLREIARQARIAEEKRRKKQAQVDKTYKSFFNFQKTNAREAIDRLAKKGDVGDWRTFFDESGKFRGDPSLTKPGVAELGDTGFKSPRSWLSFDSRFANARAGWSAWYKSPEGREYQRTVEEYRRRAQRLIDNAKKAPSDGLFSQIVDKLTFGGTRRAMGAREQAAKFYEETMKTQTKKYEEMTNALLKGQAAWQQRVQKKKFSSWAEYNKAAADFRRWEAAELKRLGYAKAATQGSLEGYSGKAKEPINNLPGKIGNWAYKNIVTGLPGQITGNIWKYTLGSGDENLPSIVTAPSRAVNFIGNLLDPKGAKNLHGGKTVQGIEKGKNAWTETFNQRNFNIGQPKKFTEKGFEAWFKTRNLKGWADTDPAKVKKLYRQAYQSQLHGDKWANYATEMLADPLFVFGVGKGAKAAEKVGGWLSRASKPLAKSKFIQQSGKFLQATKATKAVSWLKAEAKSPQQKFIDTRAQANRVIDDAQRSLLPRLRELNLRLATEKKVLAGKFDDSVLDEFRRLAEQGDDEAAKWLQQMQHGDFTMSAKLKNWTRAGGLGSNPRLTRLKDLAERWSAFAQKMEKADKVGATSYGKNRRRSFYSPRVDYKGEHSAANYDFTKSKKFHTDKHAQSAEDLYRGMVERYFKSDVIDAWGDAQKGKIGKLDRGMQDLLDRYETQTGGARAATEAAYRKTRTPYGRARGFLGKYGPTSLWKKSVLKYRPAWYTNNFLYNTQAAGLAGGLPAIVEQFRLMRPKNYRKALAELPPEVRTQVANEIGSGRISKFGSAVENVSRMGAYRALKKRGFSHEKSLKRVNSYLFDYSTKNYERPLKAVMPFYSFQKGLGKAAVKLPFDKPSAAIGYNRLDRNQKQQFDTDFAKLVPRLKKYGYTDEQIEQIRQEQAKYFAGRLKVGDRYITTPFNAFSEKGGFAGAGINPWLSAFAETAAGKDTWGRQLSGSDANLPARLLGKFPQADLARKGISKFLVSTGRLKPSQSWIGANGSGGYGMTKEAQGYDATKANYRQSLDPGVKFNQDLAAFFGVPRGLKFDGDKLVERKKLQKLKEEYFAVDWKSMPFPEQQKRQAALFKKFGMTSDQFYKGELSKYDTAHTKHIKAMKEDAFKKTRALYEEYGRQPRGTRGVWATKKLKQLVDEGYFAKNPFLKSFDWTNPGTIAKAYKKMDYDAAKASGDWSKYRSKYGDKYGRKVSQKSLDYKRAKATGDWTAYTKKYGSKYAKSAKAKFWTMYVKETDPVARRQMLRDHPEYAKRRPKSEAAIAEAKFWSRYAAASASSRRELLKDNPKYNRRSGWSDAMWDDWKARQKEDQRRRAAKMPGFAALVNKNLAMNERLAAPVIAKKTRPKGKKLAFVLS